MNLNLIYLLFRLFKRIYSYRIYKSMSNTIFKVNSINKFIKTSMMFMKQKQEEILPGTAQNSTARHSWSRDLGLLLIQTSETYGMCGHLLNSFVFLINSCCATCFKKLFSLVSSLHLSIKSFSLLCCGCHSFYTDLTSGLTGILMVSCFLAHC